MTAKTSRDKRVEEKIRCDACPVMCYIANGRSGACDRYANEGGQLIRLDPLMVMQRRVDNGGELVPFHDGSDEWNGDLITSQDAFVTAVGAGTTYPCLLYTSPSPRDRG